MDFQMIVPNEDTGTVSYGNNPAMGSATYTPEQIQGYMAANQGLTNDQIIGLQQQYGVSAGQLDSAMQGQNYKGYGEAATAQPWNNNMTNYVGVDRQGFRDAYGTDFGVAAPDRPDQPLYDAGRATNTNYWHPDANWQAGTDPWGHDQYAQFNNLLDTNKYSDAYQYARDQGYTDQQVADYYASMHDVSSPDAMQWIQGYNSAQRPIPPKTTGGLTAAGTNSGSTGLNDALTSNSHVQQGDSSYMFPNTTTPQNDGGIPWRGLDARTPRGGQDWRDTVTGANGTTDESIYAQAMASATEGNTLTSWGHQLGLNPGEVMAMYDKAVKYARANGKPLPSFPAQTAAEAPYKNYGFHAGKQLLNREFGTGANKTNVVNPLANYLQQIRDLQAQQAAPVAKAHGGRIGGGLQGIKDDPIIQRYMRGGKGGGQDDTIHAALSNNEYVFDADVVAAIGDGSPDEGARKLDQMRQNIRKHKRSGPTTDIPPKAKAPEQYLKGK